jgi:hypothetical protein
MSRHVLVNSLQQLILVSVVVCMLVPFEPRKTLTSVNLAPALERLITALLSHAPWKHKFASS